MLGGSAASQKEPLPPSLPRALWHCWRSGRADGVAGEARGQLTQQLGIAAGGFSPASLPCAAKSGAHLGPELPTSQESWSLPSPLPSLPGIAGARDRGGLLRHCHDNGSSRASRSHHLVADGSGRQPIHAEIFHACGQVVFQQGFPHKVGSGRVVRCG